VLKSGEATLIWLLLRDIPAWQPIKMMWLLDANLIFVLWKVGHFELIWWMLYYVGQVIIYRLAFEK
jgi:hypothetical protein